MDAHTKVVTAGEIAFCGGGPEDGRRMPTNGRTEPLADRIYVPKKRPIKYRSPVTDVLLPTPRFDYTYKYVRTLDGVAYYVFEGE